MNRSLLIGIGSAIGLSAAGMLCAAYLPGPGALTITIVFGMLAANLTPLREMGKDGVRFCEKRCLHAAIACMGFELQLSAARGLGGRAVAVIAGVIISSLLLGLIISRFSSLPKKLVLLLGIGNGICGSAAIAASAPLLEAEKEDVGISVAVINLIGAGAIFFLPFLAGVLKLDQGASALLIGGTVQAVGQTLAAALQLGGDTGKLAIVVKMGRVLMLGFVLLFISMAAGRKKSSGFPLPPFIVAFLATALAVNLLPLPSPFIDIAAHLKKALLYPAMAAIGMGIDLKSIRRFGPAALAIALGIFAWNIALVLLIALS